ncbi:ArgS-related anticodon-binding protein NrtL [Streptomyces beihaiensis]|uniref:arginine--tRNA ligase n=1 Tax=Streptomyces beihaiensis TaxID=2984495 RepID=A0ABT3U429_9ACTN|nr:DALR anticodon-binding domain-containing protein [Streptomyces beihaiensis]MCX3064085.1 DALR anticodon-binding domain-containing protein [Streptomyces beihaiensis]
MTPAELSRTVLRAVGGAVDDGEFRAGARGGGGARIVVERPRAGGHGDYATNVALQIAKAAGRPPREVAEVLSRRLTATPGIVAADVTGPGFLNLTLGARGRDCGPLVEDIQRQGLLYGHGDSLRGHRVELRVPDEPRARVVADAVARIGRSQGAEVHVVRAQRPGDVTFRPVPAHPRDLVRLIGSDAARWALLRPAVADHPRTATAVERAAHLAQRESNPLFRVRYAHARTRALTRNAADLGFRAQPGDGGGADVQDGLVAALADHPRILLSAARHRAPDRLARHLVDVADLFLARLNTTVLPVGEEKPSAAHRARLALAEATGTVLAGGLSLLGIDAPQHL